MLDSLLGVHSGPKVWPLLPVPSKTLRVLADLGLDFVQYGPVVRLSPSRAQRFGLKSVASATWNLFPGDGSLDRTLTAATDAGFDSVSLLVGGGLLSDDDAFRRAELLAEAAQRCAVPITLETHRATITESIPRTVEIARRFPELRFNLDLSHWFVTHRLDRLAVEDFVAQTSPVLTRVDLIHGRVSSTNEIQTPLAQARHREWFEEVWERVTASVPGVVRFAPELLPATMGYASPHHRLRWEDTLDLLRVRGAIA